MGTVIATVIVLAAVILAFIWTRSGNRKVGGKCSQNEGGCASCDDTSCPASKAVGKEDDTFASGKRYDAVFFDLDGTLLDTSLDLTAAVNHVREMTGLSPVGPEIVKSELGRGVINLLRKFLPDGISDDEFDAMYEEFRSFYRAHSQDRTFAYEGMRPLLETLKNAGYKIAVITNKNDEIARVLTDSYFPGLVDRTLGRTKVFKKPDPAMMRVVLSELEVEPGRVLYVGDSEVDYEFAKAAGTDLVLVSWGFRKREELENLGRVCVVDDVKGILTQVTG